MKSLYEGILDDQSKLLSDVDSGINKKLSERIVDVFDTITVYFRNDDYTEPDFRPYIDTKNLISSVKKNGWECSIKMTPRKHIDVFKALVASFENSKNYKHPEDYIEFISQFLKPEYEIVCENQQTRNNKESMLFTIGPKVLGSHMKNKEKKYIHIEFSLKKRSTMYSLGDKSNNFFRNKSTKNYNI